MLIGLGGLGPKEIVVAIVALCVVIIVHELGHFLAAIWTGMKVDRFSVFGIGPSILKLGTWRGTEFVIGAIPFGAYVLIRGMEPESYGLTEGTDPDAPPRPAEREHSSNFRDKPLWARMTVIAGGPVANYLLAILLLLGIYTIAGVRGPVQQISVDAFAETSAAQTAGLQLGDELVQIGEHRIDPALGSAGVNDAAKPYLGQDVEIVVRREGELSTHAAHFPPEGPALGVTLFLHSERQPVGLGTALSRASTEPFIASASQLHALYQLATGKLKADMQGPVGIVREIARSADAGIIPFVTTAALISTLLGMFNLLPLPALDGGRLAFLGFEAVARRRANPRVEELVHGYGMLALLALILLVTVGDVRRLF
jgi:regulator of sigma E protease